MGKIEQIICPRTWRKLYGRKSLYKVFHNEFEYLLAFLIIKLIRIVIYSRVRNPLVYLFQVFEVTFESKYLNIYYDYIYIDLRF